MNKLVYNFEFPAYCNEISIFDYKFVRVDDYKNQLLNLQHLSAVSHEFNILPNTGVHAVTAYVEIPIKEEKAVLYWAEKETTALNDILLLISLFTERDVFIKEGNGIIMEDSRIYKWGSALKLPYKAKHINSYQKYDIGFEEGINRIYELIRSIEWQNKYKKGYFLFITNHAFRWHILEIGFLLCWTIWEHLFTILNDSSLSDQQMMNIRSYEKISFLLINYGLRANMDNASRKQIKLLSEIRNKIVHYGRFINPPAIKKAVLFIRLTEFIIAKILGLFPSDIFNTMDELDKFLKPKNEQNDS